jgi:site-specific recombinase XerD
LHDLITLDAPLPPAFPPPPPLTEKDKADIEEFRANEKAAATRRAYAADWKHFLAWCKEREHPPLPAHHSTVCAHISNLTKERGYAAASVARRLAGIAYHHEMFGHPDPTQDKTVKVVMAGIRRTQKARPKAQKAPALAPMVAAMLAATAADIVGVRDRALIAVGFACALRRSELVALRVEDLEWCDDGARITIPFSKTDQGGEGQTIALPHGAHIRPVKLLRAWLDAARITAGPIFRRLERGGDDGWIILPEPLSGHAVARTVKKLAERCGYDPAKVAGHSLRSGLITEAAKHGASIWKIIETSRHRNIQTVQGYVRDADLFHSHCTSGWM